MHYSLVKRVASGVLSPILAMLLILGLNLPAFAQTKPQVDLSGKNVLVLHGHEASAPLFVDTDKGLSTTLESGGIPRVNQYFETLDLRRNPGPEHRKLLAELMRMRYVHRKPAMIITMYPEALDFVLKDCWDVFPDAPIVALYLPHGIDFPKADRLIIGHFPTFDIIGTLEIALKLVPGAKRIYVVSGAHEVDRRVEDQARRDLKKREGQLEFRYLSHMPFEDILADISTAPSDTIILLLTFSQEATGKNHTTPEVARRLSQVSTAPIFGILDVTLGHGIAGGSLVNFEHIGTKAGQLALDILGGTKSPGNIPATLDAPSVPMFDWQQLRHWNLNEDALPKGSIVINKEATFWDFKYYIIGGFTLCLLQSLLIVGLLLQRRRKKGAEQALKKSEDRFRMLIETMNEGLGVGNENVVWTYVNDQLCWLLGDFAGNIIGRPLTDFLDEANQSVLREQVEKQKKGDYSTYEITWTRADGRKMTTIVSPRPIFNPEGQLKEVFAVITDITERKRAEAEAFQTRSQLLRLDRLSRMGELTASLAHELNQPLAAILSNAQAGLRFLQSAKIDLDEIREILQDITQDDQRAGNVIRSLRSMVKREEVERNPVILNNVVNDVIQMLHTESIFRNVHVETELDGSLPPIMGDKVQLQQVVLNLTLNAADAMSDNPPEHRQILLGTGVKDDRVRVAVRDFGPGIDKGNLERIFEPFFSTKGAGLGMGLAVCRTIVEAHGGRIWAENNSDRGATLFFELPVVCN